MAIPDETDALGAALAALNRVVVDQESLDERLRRVMQHGFARRTTGRHPSLSRIRQRQLDVSSQASALGAAHRAALQRLVELGVRHLCKV